MKAEPHFKPPRYRKVPELIGLPRAHGQSRAYQPSNSRKLQVVTSAHAFRLPQRSSSAVNRPQADVKNDPHLQAIHK